MSMELQLVEALCGFKNPIQTLDNRTLLITSHPGKSKWEMLFGSYFDWQPDWCMKIFLCIMR